jgi:transcriptional regulator with XRE-family HTH domain
VIAQNIRKYRQLRNLTQVEFAQRLRVTQAYVTALETGRKVPSVAMLERMGKALRVAPSRFLVR